MTQIVVLQLSEKEFGSSLFLEGLSACVYDSSNLMLLFFLKKPGNFYLLSSKIISSSSWITVTSFYYWLDCELFSSLGCLLCFAICS